MDWNRNQVRKQDSYLVTRDSGKRGEPCIPDVVSKLTFAFSHPMVMAQYIKLLLGGGISTHLSEFASWMDELESVATPVSCALANHVLSSVHLQGHCYIARSVWKCSYYKHGFPIEKSDGKKSFNVCVKPFSL